ncbi:hypothetical protein QTN25_007425 [Entamoeba marina]
MSSKHITKQDFDRYDQIVLIEGQEEGYTTFEKQLEDIILSHSLLGKSEEEIQPFIYYVIKNMTTLKQKKQKQHNAIFLSRIVSIISQFPKLLDTLVYDFTKIVEEDSLTDSQIIIMISVVEKVINRNNNKELLMLYLKAPIWKVFFSSATKTSSHNTLVDLLLNQLYLEEEVVFACLKILKTIDFSKIEKKHIVTLLTYFVSNCFNKRDQHEFCIQIKEFLSYNHYTFISDIVNAFLNDISSELIFIFYEIIHLPEYVDEKKYIKYLCDKLLNSPTQVLLQVSHEIKEYPEKIKNKLHLTYEDIEKIYKEIPTTLHFTFFDTLPLLTIDLNHYSNILNFFMNEFIHKLSNQEQSLIYEISFQPSNIESTSDNKSIPTFHLTYIFDSLSKCITHFSDEHKEMIAVIIFHGYLSEVGESAQILLKEFDYFFSILERQSNQQSIITKFSRESIYFLIRCDPVQYEKYIETVISDTYLVDDIHIEAMLTCFNVLISKKNNHNLLKDPITLVEHSLYHTIFITLLHHFINIGNYTEKVCGYTKKLLFVFFMTLYESEVLPPIYRKHVLFHLLLEVMFHSTYNCQLKTRLSQNLRQLIQTNTKVLEEVISLFPNIFIKLCEQQHIINEAINIKECLTSLWKLLLPIPLNNKQTVNSNDIKEELKNTNYENELVVEHVIVENVVSAFEKIDDLYEIMEDVINSLPFKKIDQKFCDRFRSIDSIQRKRLSSINEYEVKRSTESNDDKKQPQSYVRKELTNVINTKRKTGGAKTKPHKKSLKKPKEVVNEEEEKQRRLAFEKQKKMLQSIEEVEIEGMSKNARFSRSSRKKK